MTTPHKWVKSTLGHGETMCSVCYVTNREAAVLGELDDCPGSVSAVDKKTADRIDGYDRDDLGESPDY